MGNSGSVFFLILRRMRVPLIVLIVIYAISVLGLTLVPGVDANGQPAPALSFFHAFYFISYTATTIGFGEIPNAFSDAQRLWVIVCIYLTVIGWSYSIITLLALVQDKAFQNVLVNARFARRVRHLHEPFYLVCGCGETGALVCRALDELNIRFVVIESREARVQALDLEDFKTDVPALAADAQQPGILEQAGLGHAKCRGVLALTNDDNANLAIAIAVRLLVPDLPVLARAESPMTEANMASFGTHHIINPYARFADYLGLAIEAPNSMRLIEWLTGLPGQHLPPIRRPPTGKWIVCGHGRFSRPVIRQLADHAVQVCVVTPEPGGAVAPGFRHVAGLGTEAVTLQAAGVEQAVGLVAGTDHDVNNLSIAMTAKDLNPSLFIVARQNWVANEALFKAFEADFTMVPSRIVAHESLATIITPLMAAFLAEVRRRPDVWAADACTRLEEVCGGVVPLVWDVEIDAQSAPAIVHQLTQGPVSLQVLLQSFENREEALELVPLLLVREGASMVFPETTTALCAGDALLFAGSAEVREKQRMALSNANALEYLLTGQDHPAGLVWQWLTARSPRT
ncbi:MAG: NAD-binding protein [Zoogloeaceae bacterium]|nr:NAD-binding protein [Zoogloeaceae bacterium]